MGAALGGVPAILLVGRADDDRPVHGERLGACTDCRRFWARYRAGEIDDGEIDGIEENLATTAGTCAVMGTASTMACLAETLGMSPARRRRRSRPSTPTVCASPRHRAPGRRAAASASRRPDRDARGFENALRVLLAIGGSTNAVVHLTAIAGRLGIGLDLSA